MSFFRKDQEEVKVKLYLPGVCDARTNYKQLFVLLGERLFDNTALTGLANPRIIYKELKLTHIRYTPRTLINNAGLANKEVAESLYKFTNYKDAF